MKIFISYRRDDSAGYAGRLFDYLTAHFGEKNIFMDVDTIQPGEDFRKAVSNAVGTCDVVLVVIGKQWLSIADAQGRRRLDNPQDWVRVEIASALADPRVRVIPVLVREAGIPGTDELPDDLKELSWRNASELSDTRFQHDARKLIEVIERASGKPGGILAGGRNKSRAVRSLGVVLGLAGLGLIGWLVSYAIGMRSTPGSSTPLVMSTSTGIPAPTSAPAATDAPTAIPSETPTSSVRKFFDNFDNGIDAAIWAVNLNDWSPTDSGGIAAAQIYNGAAMFMGDPGWQDYQVSVNTSSSTGQPTSYFAAVFLRYQDRDNHVQFAFDCDYPASTIVWRYRQNGILTEVNTTRRELGLCRSEPYIILLVVRGNRYAAIVDGQETAFQLDLFTQGQVGLYSGENGGAAAAAFDNFLIEP